MISLFSLKILRNWISDENSGGIPGSWTEILAHGLLWPRLCLPVPWFAWAFDTMLLSQSCAGPTAFPSVNGNEQLAWQPRH